MVMAIMLVFTVIWHLVRLMMTNILLLPATALSWLAQGQTVGRLWFLKWPSASFRGSQVLMEWSLSSHRWEGGSICRWADRYCCHPVTTNQLVVKTESITEIQLPPHHLLFTLLGWGGELRTRVDIFHPTLRNLIVPNTYIIPEKTKKKEWELQKKKLHKISFQILLFLSKYPYTSERRGQGDCKNHQQQIIISTQLMGPTTLWLLFTGTDLFALIKTFQHSREQRSSLLLQHFLTSHIRVEFITFD